MKMINNDSQKFVRSTYYMREDIIEALRAIAYWDRKTIKEVVHDMALKYVQEYEAKNGEIKPVPERVV